MENIPLPVWVRSSILTARQHDRDNAETEVEVMQSAKLSRKDMEKEIAEFLLPDDE